MKKWLVDGRILNVKHSQAKRLKDGLLHPGVLLEGIPRSEQTGISSQKLEGKIKRS